MLDLRQTVPSRIFMRAYILTTGIQFYVSLPHPQVFRVPDFTKEHSQVYNLEHVAKNLFHRLDIITL